MKILNYGSLNIDHVYAVNDFVKAGETISASDCQIHTGGKGLNQSVALGRAGADVYHGGKIGSDGISLVKFLESAGVKCDFIKTDPHAPTGHAIIQVTPSGENSIIVYGGSNRTILKEEADEALKYFTEGDFLLLQNEICLTDYIIGKAHGRGMKIMLNPSPITDELLGFTNLGLVDWLIVNRAEGAKLGNVPEGSPDNVILDAMTERFPHASVVLTLGKRGAVCKDNGTVYRCGIYDYGKPVDTTGAGDTFTGFFLAGIASGAPVGKAMENASRASGISVTRHGAAESIPYADEIKE